jgi:kynurenine formamidase
MTPVQLETLFAGSTRTVDLSHPMANGMPVWPTHPPFRQTPMSRFEDGDISLNHLLALSEHTGTHIDAPAHFVPGGASIAEVPLERFFGRMVAIDASDMAPDTELGPERILAFEAAHGPIRPGDAVMFRFGWERYWGHPTEGEKYYADWPGLSAAAALLLRDRGIRLAACDCMAIDRFGNADFPVHHILLGAGILIGENFRNLALLPPIAWLIAMPFAIEGGSASPVRAVAFLPD